MKQYLLNLSVIYLNTDDFVQSRPLSILVNNENEIFKISSSNTKCFECNYKKADARIIFPSIKQKINVLVCSKGTDILVWMVFAYALNKTNEK